MSKKRKKLRTRLSGRNALRAVNGLLKVLNPLLAEIHRVPPVRTPADLHLLLTGLNALTPQPSAATPAAAPDDAVLPSVKHAIATIATRAWRARSRVSDEATGQPQPDLKNVCRDIDSILNALDKLGVTTMSDFSGRAYDTGMALKVLSFEETPGLPRETIIEIIKPTVRWRDEFIQIGEVVVGTPPTASVEKG